MLYLCRNWRWSPAVMAAPVRDSGSLGAWFEGKIEGNGGGGRGDLNCVVESWFNGLNHRD